MRSLRLLTVTEHSTEIQTHFKHTPVCKPPTCLHSASMVVPARSCVSTTGSAKSGREPVFFVYTRTCD